MHPALGTSHVALGTLVRRPRQYQEFHRSAGPPMGDRQPLSRRHRRRRRRAAGRTTQGRGRHRDRRDERRRAAHGVGDRQRALRPDEQPVGARSHAGRIERRRSGGHRRGPLRRRHRQRRRRIDSRARALQRHLRPQADAGPRAGHRTLPALRRSLRAHRRRRADGANGGRHRDDGGGDGGTRHRRSERTPGAVHAAGPGPAGHACWRLRRRWQRAGDGGIARRDQEGRCGASRRRVCGRRVPARRPRGSPRALVGDLRPRGRPRARADSRRARGGGPPEPAAVPRVDSPRSEADGRATAGRGDQTRPSEGPIPRADATLSPAALPRGANPCVPPR